VPKFHTLLRTNTRMNDRVREFFKYITWLWKYTLRRPQNDSVQTI